MGLCRWTLVQALRMLEKSTHLSQVIISLWETVLGLVLITGHHVTKQSNLPTNYWVLPNPPVVKPAWTAFNTQVSNIEKWFKCPQFPLYGFFFLCLHLWSLGGFTIIPWQEKTQLAYSSTLYSSHHPKEAVTQSLLKQTPRKQLSGLGKHFLEGCIRSESASHTWCYELHSLQHCESSYKGVVTEATSFDYP